MFSTPMQEAELCDEDDADGPDAGEGGTDEEHGAGLGVSDDDRYVKRARLADGERANGEEQELSPGPGRGIAETRPVATLAESGLPTSLCPPHPGFVHGMCVRCCAHKQEELGESGGPSVAFSWLGQGLELSAAEAARLRGEEALRRLSARKLLLVLDLDHTLLNSCHVSELEPTQAQQLRQQAAGDGSRPGGQQLFELAHGGLLTKLRPGARALLEALAPFFELHVYTMGDRNYAHLCARLLDPESRLLGARIVSKADSTALGAKDLDVLLTSDASCLILDDSEHVWPRHGPNLLRVERYHYFPRSAAAFREPGTGLWAAGRDEDEGSGCMSALTAALQACHAAFFDGLPPAGDPALGGAASLRDVRAVLAAQRARVLAGCCVAFSGIIPLGCARPTAHPTWLLALSLGAVVDDAPTARTTHLVASKPGTAKGDAAAKAGLHCVQPAWLQAAAVLWRRPDESLYPLVLPPAPGAGKKTEAAAEETS